MNRKWTNELDYRLIKELWAFRDDRLAVRFAYEWHDDSGNWFRAYGNENWEFNDAGLMPFRIASINDLSISANERDTTGRSAAGRMIILGSAILGSEATRPSGGPDSAADLDCLDPEPFRFGMP